LLRAWSLSLPQDGVVAASSIGSSDRPLWSSVILLLADQVRPLGDRVGQGLSERGLKVAILCSDYGGRRKGHLQASGDWQGVEAWHSGWSDEATLLSMQSACPVFVDSDRSAALALCLSTQSHFDIILQMTVSNTIGLNGPLKSC
jgi:hypothetical protein